MEAPIPLLERPAVRKLARRSAVTLVGIAAFLALSVVPLPGIRTSELAKTYESLHQSEFTQDEGYPQSLWMSGTSIGGLGVNSIVIGFMFALMVSRVLPDRFRDPDPARVVRRLTIPLALGFSVWLAHTVLRTLVKSAGDLIDDPGIFGYWIPGMAGLVAGFLLCCAIAQWTTRFGLGDGVLVLLSAASLTDLVAYAPYLPARLSRLTAPRGLIVAGILIAVLILTAVHFLLSRSAPLPVSHVNYFRSRVTPTSPVFRLLPFGIWPLLMATGISAFFSTLTGLGLRLLRIHETELPYCLLTVALLYLFSWACLGASGQSRTYAVALLQERSFLPGIRPGRRTEAALTRTAHRGLLVGTTAMAVLVIGADLYDRYFLKPALLDGLFTGQMLILWAATGSSIARSVDACLSRSPGTPPEEAVGSLVPADSPPPSLDAQAEPPMEA